MKRILYAFFALCLILSALAAPGCAKRQTGPEPESYTYSFTPSQTAAPETAVPPETTAAAAETTTAPPETTTAPPETTAAAPETTAAPPVTTTAPPPTAAPEKTTVPEKTTEPEKTTAPEKTTVTEKTTAPEPTSAAQTCTVEIRCDTVLQNLGSLKKNKAGFVPESGVILPKTAVACSPGDTVFEVIRRVCAAHPCAENCVYCRAGGIQIEYTYTPGLATYYIEGVHQLYEKDCGMYSGWMYSVNGVFPNVGVSEYAVSPGDEILFAYTCDMGEDIGNHF